MQENLSGVVVIKIFGREPEEAARFRAATDAHYRQQIKAIQRPQPVLPVHARGRVLQQRVHDRRRRVAHARPEERPRFTVGDLVLFRSYWWRLFGPIQTLARLNDMVQRANAACRRVFDVLDAPEELPEPADARAGRPRDRGDGAAGRVVRLPGR